MPVCERNFSNGIYFPLSKFLSCVPFFFTGDARVNQKVANKGRVGLGEVKSDVFHLSLGCCPSEILYANYWGGDDDAGAFMKVYEPSN